MLHTHTPLIVPTMVETEFYFYFYSSNNFIVFLFLFRFVFFSHFLLIFPSQRWERKKCQEYRRTEEKGRKIKWKEWRRRTRRCYLVRDYNSFRNLITTSRLRAISLPSVHEQIDTRIKRQQTDQFFLHYSSKFKERSFFSQSFFLNYQTAAFLINEFCSTFRCVPRQRNDC